MVIWVVVSCVWYMIIWVVESCHVMSLWVIHDHVSMCVMSWVSWCVIIWVVVSLYVSCDHMSMFYHEHVYGVSMYVSVHCIIPMYVSRDHMRYCIMIMVYHVSMYHPIFFLCPIFFLYSLYSTIPSSFNSNHVAIVISSGLVTWIIASNSPMPIFFTTYHMAHIHIY